MENTNIDREKLIAFRQGYSPSQQRDYWKNEERQQLEDMYYDGFGISEMALSFNRSECAIYNQLEVMGLFRKSRRKREKSTECKCPKCNCPDCPKPTVNQDDLQK